MPARHLHVDRRLVATLAAAWGLVLAGVILDRSALLLVGALLGAVAFLGVSVPSKAAVRADHRVGATTPTEGQAFRSAVTATNSGRRSYLVEWKLELPDLAQVDAGRSAGFLVLPKGGERRLDLELEMLLFGLHRVGPLDLRLGDPFGFVALETTAGDPVDLRVYPRRSPMKQPVTRADQQRSMIGRYEVSQPGQGFEFFGLRKYHHGDQPKKINWKASARSKDLIVNQHERETNAEIVVLVDTRQDTLVGRQLESPFAEGCRAALSLAETHLNARDDVRFLAYGDDEAKRDRHTGAERKLRGILDLMLDLEPSGDRRLADLVDEILPHLSPRSPVFIFSPLVGDDSFEDAVLRLLSHEFPVTVLVPRPHWGDGDRTTEQMLWEAEQDRRLRSIRRRGALAAYLDPDVPLYTLLRRIEVIL